MMLCVKGLRMGPAHLHGQDVDQRQAVAVPRERLHRQKRGLQQPRHCSVRHLFMSELYKATGGM